VVISRPFARLRRSINLTNLRGPEKFQIALPEKVASCYALRLSRGTRFYCSAATVGLAFSLSVAAQDRRLRDVIERRRQTGPRSV